MKRHRVPRKSGSYLIEDSGALLSHVRACDDGIDVWEHPDEGGGRSTLVRVLTETDDAPSDVEGAGNFIGAAEWCGVTYFVFAVWWS